MPAAGEEQPVESTFKIKVDGSDLPEEGVRENVGLVRVVQLHDGPSSFEFSINLKDPVTYPLSSLTAGAQVEILMGFGTPVTVFKGLITQVEVNYPATTPPICLVSGYDRLHTLTRGRFTEHWESVKYSDVVSSIAGKTNLSGSAKDTSIQHKYVAMNNQTYFSFIMDMARRVGYEVNVDDKTLNFRPSETGGGEVATVKWGEDVTTAKFRMQSTGQITDVNVLGYDDTQKKQIVGKAAPGDVSGSGTGVSLVNSKFGKAPFWVSNYAATSQAEADKIAKAVLNQVALQFCTVEAELQGNTAIKAATVIKLEDVVPPFAGKYYVTRAVHEVAAGKSRGPVYMTKIIAVRNFWSL